MSAGFCRVPAELRAQLDYLLDYFVMECLGVLLAGNANNAAVFRESGGARCAHNLIPFADCRREALCKFLFLPSCPSFS